MSSTVASRVINEFVSVFEYFGYPKSIVSDNGPPFQSFEFNHFCKCNGIEVFKSPPYHPESNELAERCVRTVETVFNKYCLSTNDPLSMEQKVNFFLLYYRNSPTTATGQSPSSMLFAYKPRIVLDLLSKGKNQKKS